MTETVRTTNPNRNRLLAVVGGGLVVLLAALVLPKVLFGGGGDDLGAPPETAAPGSTTTTVAEAEAVPDLGALPESFSTKNPFTPLVDTSPAPAATDEVPTTDTGTGPGVTDVPADTTGGDTTEPDRESARFSLVEVYAGADGAAVASVQVDGSSFTVGEGDTFAGYTVVSLSRASGSGTFTDPQGGTFTAQTGESQLK